MANTDIDDIDTEIIRYLQQDARIAVATIAEKIDVAESTVRHRLNRLVSQEIVELSAWLNPEKAGHQVWVMLDLSVDMRKIDDVAHRLAEAPQVYYIGIATGAYDIHAAAVFRSNDDLLKFMTGPLASIPGIQRVSTSTIIKKIKRTYRYTVPDSVVERRAEVPAKAAANARPELRGNRVTGRSTSAPKKRARD